MGAAYMMEGIVTPSGSRMYTSLAADTGDIADNALVASRGYFKNFERVFKNIV